MIWRCSRCAVELIGLEGFERDGGIAEILEALLVEIVAPDIHRQVLAPVILDALVDDPAARLEVLDPVDAAAERRLERRGGRIALVAVRSLSSTSAWQHRKLADDLRQLAIAGPSKVKVISRSPVFSP